MAPESAQSTDACSEGDDAHVFDTGVSQHAFVLGLPKDEGGCRHDGDETEYDEDGAGKSRRAPRRA